MLYILTGRTLEEARQRGDWLFIFEAARATHLDAGAEDDLVLRFEKTGGGLLIEKEAYSLETAKRGENS